MRALLEEYTITRGKKKISDQPTLHKAMVTARFNVLNSRGAKGVVRVTHQGKVVWDSEKDPWDKHKGAR